MIDLRITDLSKTPEDGNVDFITLTNDQWAVVKAVIEKLKNDENVESHSETEIYKNCIGLMQELVDDFAEWYRWQNGEDAIEELDDEEIFCVRKTPFHIVQRLFLWNTHHSGGNSTRSKCSQLGIKDWSEDIEFGFEVEEE